MRHLFYIHSAITYLVALEVVRFNRLDRSQCCFLLGRNFYPSTPEAGIALVPLPYTHHPINSFAVERQFWKSWRKLQAFDAFVDEVTKGGEFHVYTNQTGIDFIRLLLSHKSCAGFSFLEEGLYSYYIAEKVNTEICPGGSATYFYKLLQYLNFKGRLSQQPFFFAEGYQAAYGVSDDSFPGFRNRTVLGNPFQNDDPAHSIDGHILVLDALLEYGAVTKDAYEAAISKVFSFFEECEVKRIWVKFHPEQYAHNAFLLNIRTIIAKNRGRVEVNELPPHSLLERVAGNKDCTAKFYVFLSSVGLYAALCGRAVYSFANFVGDMDRGYQSRIDSLPAVFKKRVKFL